MIETDALIIGAGPVGPVRGLRAWAARHRRHVVDILDRPGGQCAELYPEKPIYDIPALPIVTGQELTDRLMEQVKPFEPVFHFSQMVTALKRTEDGGFELRTDGMWCCAARRWWSPPAAARSSRSGRRIAGIEAYEGTSVFYSVQKMEMLRGRDVLVVGGGDSALDWTLNLQPIARSLTLLHRRDEFRAAPDSRRTRCASSWPMVRMRFLIGQVTGLQGDGRPARCGAGEGTEGVSRSRPTPCCRSSA